MCQEKLNRQEATLAFRQLQESVVHAHTYIGFWRQLLHDKGEVNSRSDFEEAERSAEQLIGQLQQIELKYISKKHPKGEVTVTKY